MTASRSALMRAWASTTVSLARRRPSAHTARSAFTSRSTRPFTVTTRVSDRKRMTPRPIR